MFPAGTGIKDRQNPRNSTKWMGIGVAESASPTGPFHKMDMGGYEPKMEGPWVFKRQGL